MRYAHLRLNTWIIINDTSIVDLNMIHENTAEKGSIFILADVE